MSQTCPKCGHRRAAASDIPDWQCPACGIAYAKYRAPAAETANAAAGLPRPPPPLLGGGRTEFGDVALMTAAATAALLGLRAWLTGDVPLVNGLIAVPFYFCVVPVVTFLWRRELWQWSRYQMRFEASDFSHRPWLGYLLALFYAGCSACFAWMIFATAQGAP
ncbi:MAG: hypothetical protein AB7Q81_06925 [Gammaproteobacteria bacterium]